MPPKKATTSEKSEKREIPKAKFSRIFNMEEMEKDPAARKAFQQFYKDNGIVCLDINPLFDLKTVVGEVVKGVFEPMPYSDEFRLQLKDANGEIVHIDNPDHRERLIALLLQTSFTPDELKSVLKMFPPHREFGAPVLIGSMSIPTAERLKDNEALYKILALLMGQGFVICKNRCIVKAPSMGDNEFLHWDWDPFSEDFDPWDESELPTRGVSGKICFTESVFVAVPGTNTKPFLELFKDLYGDIYDTRKIGVAKYGLDPKKEDPLGLFDAAVAFEVPQGHVVWWDERLLHGTRKSSTKDPIAFGQYFGAHRITEEQCAERAKCHESGDLPRKWPSGDEIREFPRRYDNFPGIAFEMVGKKYLPEVAKTLVGTRTTKMGKTVMHVKPWGKIQHPKSTYRYEPYPHTPFGRCAAGLEPWPAVGAVVGDVVGAKPIHKEMAGDTDSDSDMEGQCSTSTSAGRAAGGSASRS